MHREGVRFGLSGVGRDMVDTLSRTMKGCMLQLCGVGV